MVHSYFYINIARQLLDKVEDLKKMLGLLFDLGNMALVEFGEGFNLLL